MSCVVVVGAQWGDEGKGKIVDLYTDRADLVVRYAGGANAGHTLVVGNEKVIVRLLPSGILRENTHCSLAQGMVIDPIVLLNEIDELQARGYGDIAARLSISPRAHLILPYHQSIDALREGRASAEAAIGTTKKGIGPAYEDKARRTGIRAGDLCNFEHLKRRLEAVIEGWAPILKDFNEPLPSIPELLEWLKPIADRFLPMLADPSVQVDKALKAEQNILLEGAQGTLLDVDHGTYPFVTSSSPVSGGASTGVGMGPNRITRVIGITKAYTTRVGGGPFPTELNDATAKHLRDVGHEYGSVTKRPRRTGWLDLPALRYAIRVNGIDGLAFTKLDVLSGLSEVKVCVAYRTASGETNDFPIDELSRGETIEPIYKSFPGWNEDLTEIRDMKDLPQAVRNYVDFVTEAVETPMDLVSVGPRRSESIVLHNPFL